MSVLMTADAMLEVAVETQRRRQVRTLEYDLNAVIGKYSPACYNDPLGSGPREAYDLIRQIIEVMKPQIEEQAKDVTFRKFLQAVSDEKFHDER